MPAPVNAEDSIGEGVFYCAVPRGRASVNTIVWNPASVPLEIHITVNGKEESRMIPAGARVTVTVPVSSTNISMRFRGDRRLVLLQTDFQ